MPKGRVERFVCVVLDYEKSIHPVGVEKEMDPRVERASRSGW